MDRGSTQAPRQCMLEVLQWKFKWFWWASRQTCDFCYHLSSTFHVLRGSANKYLLLFFSFILLYIFIRCYRNVDQQTCSFYFSKFDVRFVAWFGSVCHKMLLTEYSDLIILTWCNCLWTCSFHLPFFAVSYLFSDVKIFCAWNQLCRFMQTLLWFNYSWKSIC